ncbi:MAG: glycosyltransferase family 8 protein [Alphaproteobacteria bacterium]|nr:glycosyltransferase family 8 protein [Alphaproteobacteria bacterium]
MKQIIPCILASDNRYAAFMYITMLSMLKSASDDTFYDFYLLIPSSFSNLNTKRISSLAKKYNCAINFIDMRDNFSNIKMHISHITSPTYYRLLAADLLPKKYKKCIYLDVDICVCSDLSNMFNIDIGDNYLAGVPAIGYIINEQYNCERLELPNTKNYVNAGVLIFNLECIRKDNMTKKFMSLLDKNYTSQDQDILNVACFDKILPIPVKYNVMPRCNKTEINEHFELFDSIYGIENIETALGAPVIVHYADKIKPWQNKRMRFADKWWHVAKQSPYYLSILIKYYLKKCKI